MGDGEGREVRERHRHRARVYPSLVRPVLIGGVEREVGIVLVAAVVALLLAFELNWVTPALAAGVVFGVFPWLRRRTRRDPQVFAVFRGHVRRSGVYEAQGRASERRSPPPGTF